MGSMQSYLSRSKEPSSQMSVSVPTPNDDTLDISIIPIIDVAKQAGAVIMQIYSEPSGGSRLQEKSGNSLLSHAGASANAVICDFLRTNFGNIPVMTEEAKVKEYSQRMSWKSYWCIDPLDGTKELHKRNGEFTVNIALMQNGADSLGAYPVLGVVYAPALKRCYFAVKGAGAYCEKDGFISKMTVKQFSESDAGLVLVCSRSHLDERTQAFLDKFTAATVINMGSSLKLMLIANGDAHIYPRLAPTMEWDTAASQVIVEEAGGRVINAETDKPLSYNKEHLHNPYFYVYGNRA